MHFDYYEHRTGYNLTKHSLSSDGSNGLLTHLPIDLWHHRLIFIKEDLSFRDESSSQMVQSINRDIQRSYAPSLNVKSSFILISSTEKATGRHTFFFRTVYYRQREFLKSAMHTFNKSNKQRCKFDGCGKNQKS